MKRISLNLPALLIALAVVLSNILPAQARDFGKDWLGALRAEAAAAGVSPDTLDSVLPGLKPDCQQPGVTCTAVSGEKTQPQMPPHLRGLPESCNRVTQLEFVHPARYFPEASIAQLVKRGQAIEAGWRKDKPEAYARLKAVTAQTGVSLPVLMALWARETAYGGAKLRHNAVTALASLARFGAENRRDWARGQLIAALIMLDRKVVTLEDMRSSYAGAIGLTQLTPEEYLKFGVDADEDGRADIWNSEIDALASTANVLKQRGWRGDLNTWGYEIEAPENHARFDCSLEGRFTRKSFSEWAESYGLKRLKRGRDGKPLPFPKPGQEGYAVMPAGTRGPAFLVTANFDVLRLYNMSDNYSIFVGHIADRIGCDKPGKPCVFAKPWPPKEEDNGFAFTVANMCKMQLALKQRGFYDYEVDGLFGSQTRIAIGRYQKSLGQKPDCYPSAGLFRELTGSASIR